MTEPAERSQEPRRDLRDILERGGRTRRAARFRGGVILAAVLIGAALVYGLMFGDGDGKRLRFVTEPAIVETLVVTVSATGNLQPTNQVDVGSELSGTVEAVYVDENDQVSKSQVLARLDRSKLQDAVARSEANLAAAEAQVLQAQATVAEARARLNRLRRVAAMSGGEG